MLPLPQQQISKALDEEGLKLQIGSLQASDKADLLSETLKGASCFLEAVPAAGLGNVMLPAEFSTEARRRLLIDVHESDAFCPLCDAISDKRGRHDILCPCAGDRVRRHNCIRNFAGKVACRAGLNPEFEKPGLLPPSPEQPSQDLRRPADVFLPSWLSGTPAALDFAVTSPQRQEFLRQASFTPGFAANSYTEFKKTFLNTEVDCARQGLAFLPMVAETSGGWSSSAVAVWRQLARMEALRTGESWSTVTEKVFCGLSVAIRRASARAVLRRTEGRGASLQAGSTEEEFD